MEDLNPFFLEEKGFKPVGLEERRGGKRWGERGEVGSGGSGGGGGSLEVNDGGCRAEALPGTFQTLFIGNRARERMTLNCYICNFDRGIEGKFCGTLNLFF